MLPRVRNSETASESDAAKRWNPNPRLLVRRGRALCRLRTRENCATGAGARGKGELLRDNLIVCTVDVVGTGHAQRSGADPTTRSEGAEPTITVLVLSGWWRQVAEVDGQACDRVCDGRDREFVSRSRIRGQTLLATVDGKVAFR